MQVSHMGGRAPSTQALLSCFLRHTIRDRGWHKAAGRKPMFIWDNGITGVKEPTVLQHQTLFF